MKYFSMFSGVGGFERGIEKAFNSGMGQETLEQQIGSRPKGNNDITTYPSGRGLQTTCVGYSEIDKYATAIYRYHYPEHKNFGDATKINPDTIPDFDLLVAGFPCQSFSIAGKRGGFADTRGTLFFEIARIARSKRPRYLLLENVKGLLSHDKGNTFATIISTLDELGYDCQWCVLNSKNFGVPQNRERVFIVGHIRGTPRPKVFPIGKVNEYDIKPTPKLSMQCSNTIRTNYSNGKANETYVEEIAGCLDSNYMKGDNRPSNKSKRTLIIHNSFPDKQRIYKKTSPTISTPSGGGHLPLVMNTLTEALGTRQGSSKEFLKSVDNISKSIGQIRRLTPVECERLQGFPDNWTKYGTFDDGTSKEISDTQRYKCLGNAVTTNVIETIIKEFYAL